MSKPRQLPTHGCKEIDYRPKDADEPYVRRAFSVSLEAALLAFGV